MSGTQITPEVLWAQRSSADEADRNFIYVTIMAADVAAKSMKLDLQPTGLTFTGPSDSKKATYHVQLDFYGDIDPSQSKITHSARDVAMKLQKKELKSEYWPRLLKESKKMHFLKTDFDKWVDEDEQDGAADDDYANQFGGAGAGGMPDMGAMGGMGGMGGMGMGGDGGFGGLDFSKLGGMGGAGGASMEEMMKSMGGAGAMGGAGDDDDDDDDEMPDLEDAEDTKAGSSGTASEKATSGSEATGSAKIQEVE